MMLPLVVACKVLPQGEDKPPENQQTQTGSDPALFTLGQVDATTVRPKPRPTTQKPAAGLGASDAAALTSETPISEPIVQKSTERLACEKRGGTWGNAGSTKVQSCIIRTKDGGKQCRKAGDCDSACLARSGTCAPVKPLFGCNEILQKDGSRVTLCID